eukprot:9179731-Pyramimonas_sp.AAC.1
MAADRDPAHQDFMGLEEVMGGAHRFWRDQRRQLLRVGCWSLEGQGASDQAGEVRARGASALSSTPARCDSRGPRSS